jgi:hypothetical protein
MKCMISVSSMNVSSTAMIPFDFPALNFVKSNLSYRNGLKTSYHFQL